VEELTALVREAQAGDTAAFGRIVRRFQDMAVGYAYSLLGDFHLAEDAAQDAFLGAYVNLPRLRDAEAFATWFCRIVSSSCGRQTRGKRVETVPMEAAGGVQAASTDPLEAVALAQVRQQVHLAIQDLPEHERSVAALCYISDYSQKDIAAFLGLPLTTIKKRLQYARRRLQERMRTMVEESFADNRPSRNDDFAGLTLDIIQAVQGGNLQKVVEMLNRDPDLTETEGVVPDWWSGEYRPLHVAAVGGHRSIIERLLDRGADIDARCSSWTPLAVAVISGQTDAVELLLARGAEVDLGIAVEWDDLDRVKKILADNPGFAQATFHHGAPPICCAKSVAMAEILLDHGADIDARTPGHDTTALTRALEEEDTERVDFLIARGAEVDIVTAALMGDLDRVRIILATDPGAAKTKGAHGWTALHIIDSVEVAQLLIDNGADVNALMGESDAGWSVVHWHVLGCRADLVRLLAQAGADLEVRNSLHNKTPLEWAESRGWSDGVKLLRELGATQ
jgi:RNA polymerase sigma factor (sigma-70 family)